jgi:hypothetical protein
MTTSRLAFRFPCYLQSLFPSVSTYFNVRTCISCSTFIFILFIPLSSFNLFFVTAHENNFTLLTYCVSFR